MTKDARSLANNVNACFFVATLELCSIVCVERRKRKVDRRFQTAASRCCRLKHKFN